MKKFILAALFGALTLGPAAAYPTPTFASENRPSTVVEADPPSLLPIAATPQLEEPLGALLDRDVRVRVDSLHQECAKLAAQAPGFAGIGGSRAYCLEYTAQVG